MSDTGLERRRLVEGGADGAGEDDAASLVARSLPPPIADELSQERIWRAVSQNLPEKSFAHGRQWGWVAATCGLAAVGIAIALRFAFAGSPPGRFELTSGTVLTATPEGIWRSAEAGAALPLASRVKTDGRSRALVSLSRAAVLVAPDTDVALESVESTTFLRLSRGELVAEVEPRSNGEAFVVQTTRFRVTVKGTVFAVRERADDDVTVSVSRGLVEVAGEEQRWLVPAGRSWSSRARNAWSADDISARDRSLLEAAASHAPRSNIRVEGASELEVSEGGVALGPPPVTWSAPLGRYHFVGTAPHGSAEVDATASAGLATTVQLTVRALGQTSRSSDDAAPPNSPPDESAFPPRAPAHPVEPPPQAAGQLPSAVVPHRASPASRSLATAPQSLAVTPSARSTDWRQEPPTPGASAAVPNSGGAAAAAISGLAPTQQTPPIPPVARLAPTSLRPSTSTPTGAPPAQVSGPTLANAVALSRSGNYEDAARALEGLASGEGPEADLALYELGRIEQIHLGRPQSALEAYLRYERRFPHGGLGQEVRLSAVEIELQLKDFSGALGQVDSFLRQYPDSERAPEVHLLRGNILREQGDCQRAIDEYRRARGSAQSEDALYFTAWCEERLGQREGAAASLRAYLKAFANGRHAVDARSALGAP